MGMIVRPYQPGDEQSITELLTRNTQYLRDHSFWVWINRILPANPSLISVLVDDNDVVQGHTAIMPYDIKVGNRIIKCGMSYHTLIDNKYRDGDYAFPLLKQADKLATENGIEFHFGFPNKNARPLYKLPDHYKVGKFLAIECDADLFECDNNNTSISFEQIKIVDYEFLYSLNQILDSRSKERVEICRDLKYYCSRYFFHPQGLYKSYKIISKGEFVGCLVTKIYEKDNKKYFHIIDLLVDNNKIEISQLIHAILSDFSGSCDRFSFWKINEQIKESLLNSGFMENGFDTFLGLCFLPNNRITEEEKELLLDFRNWRLVMGDSDAF